MELEGKPFVEEEPIAEFTRVTKVVDVAAYFKKQNCDKLATMKLVYWSQGYFRLFTGEDLFPEPIEAWKYGPVSPDAYSSWDSLPVSSPALPESVEVCLNLVLGWYPYSGVSLLRLSHGESPWKDAYALGQNTTIQSTKITEYFSNRTDSEARSKQFYCKVFSWSDADLAEHMGNAAEAKIPFLDYCRVALTSWTRAAKTGILA